MSEQSFVIGRDVKIVGPYDAAPWIEEFDDDIGTVMHVYEDAGTVCVAGLRDIDLCTVVPMANCQRGRAEWIPEDS